MCIVSAVLCGAIAGLWVLTFVRLWLIETARLVGVMVMSAGNEVL